MANFPSGDAVSSSSYNNADSHDHDRLRLSVRPQPLASAHDHNHQQPQHMPTNMRKNILPRAAAEYEPGVSSSKSTEVPPYPYASEYAEHVSDMPRQAQQQQVVYRRRAESLNSLGSSVAPAACPYRLKKYSEGRPERGRSNEGADHPQQPVSALEAWVKQTTEASVPRKSSLLFNTDDSRALRDPLSNPGARSDRGDRNRSSSIRRPAAEGAQEASSSSEFTFGLVGGDFGMGRSSRSGCYDERGRDGGSASGWSNGVMSGSSRRRIVKPRSLMFDTAQALNLSSSGSRAAAPDGSNPSTGLDHVQNWRHQSNAGSAFGASAEPPAADSLQVQPEGNALRSAYSTSSIGSHSRNRKNVSGSTAVTPTLAGGLGGLAGIEERALEVETFLSEQSPLRSWVRWMAKSGLKEWCIPCGLMAVVLVKWCAGLGGWSGRGMPPKFGDFEAQRHWLELTLHLPYSDWYWYDKDWWGLDYPPLTAWISLLCAKVATLVPGLSPSLALDTSRGSESALLAVFMRSTVLILDLLLYVPSVLFFLNRRLAGRSLRTRSVASISVLLQPALILIDSGHFQYNSVMLGLCALCFALLYSFLPNPGASVATAGFAGSSPPLLQTSSAQENAARTKIKSVTRQLSYQYILAAVTFSCALGFKQMALYFAPAIFSVMLGRCWGLKHIRFDKGFALFAGLSAAVIATFFLMLLPWLTSLSQLQQILIRVFPLARGLFEDKVANLWCFLSCLPVPQRFKLRNVMSISSLARLSLLTTLIAILPTCVHLFWAGMQTVSIETSIDADTRARNSGASVAGSVKGDASLAGASLRDEALPSGTRRTRKSSVAGSDAGTERMSIFSGRTAGGTAVRRPPVLSNYLGDQRPVTMVVPSPAAAILPYALLSVSMAFFLFGFQTHEKSILIPLLPLTLLMSSKGDAYSGGAGATDWEWAVLSNNLATFSMWPLLRKDGLIVQYVVITLIWNWAIGYEPFAHLREARKLFVGWFSAAVTAAILALHAAEVALPALIPSSIWTPIISRYPDLFPVLNVLLCAPCFGLVWLWSMKRQMEVGFAAGLDSLSLLQGLLRKPQTKGVRKGS